MKRYLRLLPWLFLLSLAVSFSGCLSSGGPPAPVGEIPAVVSFPESVGIDVSQAIGGGAGAGAALKGLSTPKIQTLDDFSDIISLGPITFNAFNFLLDGFLGPLADLQVPVSPTVKTFEGPMTFAPEVVVTVKIDFSDFDLDGDGATEGCTGCTCPLGCAPQAAECPSQAPVGDLRPVCYRIWLRDVGRTEFVRFSAGRIDRYATRDDPATPVDEKNAGNGSFRLGVTTGEATAPENLAFGVIYEHRDDADPAFKSTEFFVQDQGFHPETGEPTQDLVHADVQQESPRPGLGKETLKKSVKLDMRSEPDPEEGPGIVQYIGGFLDDFDFWSGTFNLQETDGSPRLSGENVCARISTGLEAPRQNCLDLGIDVGGEEFLRPAQPSDVAFPADFPATPTF
ncbi:MAG: hypothetical protein IT573_06285 [Deltaproteobacteria bacterium]|nr:hypothetical protein [Deltaproteobacteria bacterium]